MDCKDNTYSTTYGNAFYFRPGNNFATKAPHLPAIDPNLTSGHFANNIQINGFPIESKTWKKPKIDNVPEEYQAFLERLKTTNNSKFQKLFSNPDVDLHPLNRSAIDAKLTTYQSNYSPDEYMSRKKELIWRHIKPDTHRYRYHETTYNTYYDGVAEINDKNMLLKYDRLPDEVEQIKNELRKIYKTTQSTYYRQLCAPRIPKMKALLKAGKVWVPPLDAYTLRRI